MVDNVVKVAKKKGKIQKKEICFCKEEIDYIHSIGDDEKESVVFVLFCLYKYYGNVFRFKDNSLFREAKIGRGRVNLSEFINSRKDKMFYINYNSDDITYSPSEEVKSLYNENNIVLRISNFENIVYYYGCYFSPDRYMFCNKCGKIVKKIKNNQKYCIECAKNMEKENIRERVRKFREKSKCNDSKIVSKTNDLNKN